VTVQVKGVLAAPSHTVTVTVESDTDVARLRSLVTVTSQVTASPPELSMPLHWLTIGGTTSAPAGPPMTPLVMNRVTPKSSMLRRSDHRELLTDWNRCALASDGLS